MGTQREGCLYPLPTLAPSMAGTVQPPGPTKKAPALGLTKTTSPFLRFLLVSNSGRPGHSVTGVHTSPILVSCKQMAVVCESGVRRHPHHQTRGFSHTAGLSFAADKNGAWSGLFSCYSMPLLSFRIEFHLAWVPGMSPTFANSDTSKALILFRTKCFHNQA